MNVVEDKNKTCIDSKKLEYPLYFRDIARWHCR
jgi:hypothetical protein